MTNDNENQQIKRLSDKLVSVIEDMLKLKIDCMFFDDPFLNDPIGIIDNLYVNVETSANEISLERLYNLSKSLGTENITIYNGKDGIRFYMTLKLKEWIND